MQRLLMAIMAVVVAVTFSAPAFADEGKKKKPEEKKGHVVVYGGEKDNQKQKNKDAKDTKGK